MCTTMMDEQGNESFCDQGDPPCSATREQRQFEVTWRNDQKHISVCSVGPALRRAKDVGMVIEDLLDDHVFVQRSLITWGYVEDIDFESSANKDTCIIDVDNCTASIARKDLFRGTIIESTRRNAKIRRCMKPSLLKQQNEPAHKNREAQKRFRDRRMMDDVIQLCRANCHGAAGLGLIPSGAAEPHLHIGGGWPAPAGPPSGHFHPLLIPGVAAGGVVPAGATLPW